MRQSGMALQSVRYAKVPIRKPRIGRLPCRTGTGTMSRPPSENGPTSVVSSTFGIPPPGGVAPLNMYAKVWRMSANVRASA